MKLSLDRNHFPQKTAWVAVILLVVGIIATSSFYPTSKAEAKSYSTPSAPESFSQLAEMASPAVVNIRTVKTIKGGGTCVPSIQKRAVWRG